MTEESKDPSGNPIVQINATFSDILGLSKPADRLIGGILHGIGVVAELAIRHIDDKRQLELLRNYRKQLNSGDLRVSSVEVSLAERAEARIISDNIRYQNNRESIALRAIDEFKLHKDKFGRADVVDKKIDIDWLDQFWQRAERINSENIQSLWARVLVRHSQGLTGASPRLLEFLSLMSGEEIEIIERISPFIMRTRNVDPAVSAIIPTEAKRRREMTHQQIDDIERLSREMNEQIGGNGQSKLGHIGFMLGAGSWGLGLRSPYADGYYSFIIRDREFRVIGPSLANDLIFSGIGITPLGLEVSALVEKETPPEFIEMLKSIWEVSGYRFEEVIADD